MVSKFTLETNKEYWEDPSTISIIDSNLHELEMRFVSEFLRPTDVIADVGCGDGYATLNYAKRVKRCYGIERSRTLRERATSALASSGQDNVTFVEGDILNLSEYEGKFDVIITERVLINLPSWELQAEAIDNIHRCLKDGGLYVLIENTHDGNDILSDYRKRVGLEPIPVHWHNEFLDFHTFLQHIDKKFRLIKRQGFNLYYLLTRVYVQMFASFTGAGKDAKADPVFKHSDRAARILFEQIGDAIIFKDNPVFGPIQGMALQKLES